MLAEGHVSDVLKLITILHVVVQTRGATATDECTLDLNRGSGVQGILNIVFADELKPCFVDGS